MRFRALVLPLAVATRTTASSRANASVYFSCDGDKVFAGGVFAPVKGRLQVSDHAPQCFIDQDIFGGDERMPPLRGKWIQDQDNVAPYWGLSCPFEMNHYSCAPRQGDPRSPHAEHSRALRYVPDVCRLDPFDGPGFVQSMNGRHIEFMGDSITRQHFISVVCQLLPSVDWSATNSFWAHNHGDAAAPECTSHAPAPTSAASWACRRRYTGVLANVRRPNNTACVFLTTGTRVCYRGMLSRGVNQYLARFSNNVLVVANAGLHSGQATYQPVIENLVTKYKSIECGQRPILVYREHIAQHFKGNKDGSFARMEHVRQSSTPVLSVPCRARIDDRQLQARVKIERRVLAQANIPLLPVYDASSDVGCAHIGAQAKGTADCTHYCQPGVPDYWAQLLSNLVRHGIKWEGGAQC